MKPPTTQELNDYYRCLELIRRGLENYKLRINTPKPEAITEAEWIEHKRETADQRESILSTLADLGVLRRLMRLRTSQIHHDIERLRRATHLERWRVVARAA